MKERRMNQRVLVTAGASGIGLDISRAFAAQGAKIFVCDIDAKGLQDLKFIALDLDDARLSSRPFNNADVPVA